MRLSNEYRKLNTYHDALKELLQCVLTEVFSDLLKRYITMYALNTQTHVTADPKYKNHNIAHMLLELQ